MRGRRPAAATTVARPATGVTGPYASRESIVPSLEHVPALGTGVSEPARTDSWPRNDFPDLARRGSDRSCRLRGTFQNEIAALRMKGERLLPARHSPAFGGVKVALQTGEE